MSMPFPLAIVLLLCFMKNTSLFLHCIITLDAHALGEDLLML